MSQKIKSQSRSHVLTTLLRHIGDLKIKRNVQAGDRQTS